MKKKLVAVIMSVSVLFSISTWSTIAVAAGQNSAFINGMNTEAYLLAEYNDITLHNAEGETQTVSGSVFPILKDMYKDMGWYPYPVTYIYAADGRKEIIATSEVENYVAVGWYPYPVTKMYAPDGREIVVASCEVTAYEAVGWYTVAYRALYSADGRSILVHPDDVTSYREVGWHATYDEAVFMHSTPVNLNYYIEITLRKYIQMNGGEDINYTITDDNGYFVGTGTRKTYAVSENLVFEVYAGKYDGRLHPDQISRKWIVVGIPSLGSVGSYYENITVMAIYDYETGEEIFWGKEKDIPGENSYHGWETQYKKRDIGRDIKNFSSRKHSKNNDEISNLFNPKYYAQSELTYPYNPYSFWSIVDTYKLSWKIISEFNGQ